MNSRNEISASFTNIVSDQSEKGIKSKIDI